MAGEPLRLKVMKHPYKDRWFADPFILDVTDQEIILLVECVTDDTKRGRIAIMHIDKSTYTLKDMKYILDLPTHLSFPVIVRKNNRVYVYPENGESGKLNLYELDLKKGELVFVEQIMDKALGDAIITTLFGEKMMFATEEPDMNGRELVIYRTSNNTQWVLDEKVAFADNVARNAGDFFRIGENIYRPAQECNEDYGHGLVIQQVTSSTSSNGNKWIFKEIRRMVSPLKRYPMCLHTLNYYNGVVVMDVKGFRYGVVGSLLFRIKKLILR